MKFKEIFNNIAVQRSCLKAAMTIGGLAALSGIWMAAAGDPAAFIPLTTGALAMFWSNRMLRL